MQVGSDFICIYNPIDYQEVYWKQQILTVTQTYKDALWKIPLFGGLICVVGVFLILVVFYFCATKDEIEYHLSLENSSPISQVMDSVGFPVSEDCVALVNSYLSIYGPQLKILTWGNIPKTRVCLTLLPIWGMLFLTIVFVFLLTRCHSTMRSYEWSDFFIACCLVSVEVFYCIASLVYTHWNRTSRLVVTSERGIVIRRNLLGWLVGGPKYSISTFFWTEGRLQAINKRQGEFSLQYGECWLTYADMECARIFNNWLSSYILVTHRANMDIPTVTQISAESPLVV